MNFLSHHYLHRDLSDEYFTVGLTIPDIVSMHAKGVSLGESYLKRMDYALLDQHLRSLAAGILIHCRIDRWFHSHEFFEWAKNVLKNEAMMNYGKKINDFFSHVLVEIIIDRTILKDNPSIGDEFYSLYKNFNFSDIVKFFSGLKTFHTEKFYHYIDDFTVSEFLKDYVDFGKIMGLTESISKKVGQSLIEPFEYDKALSFVNKCYNAIENRARLLLVEGKELLSTKKIFTELDEITDHSLKTYPY